jgi:hypothetical protein
MSIKGVIAICRNGRNLLATATCFDQDWPGYSSLQSAQESRARDRLDRAILRALLGEKLGDAVCRREFLPQKLVGSLVENADFQIDVIAIGYDGDAA